MEKVNLKHIELQTEALIKTCQRLKQENLYLLDKQSILIREKNELQEKHRQAISKINSLIKRLETIEDR